MIGMIGNCGDKIRFIGDPTAAIRGLNGRKEMKEGQVVQQSFTGRPPPSQVPSTAAV